MSQALYTFKTKPETYQNRAGATVTRVKMPATLSLSHVSLPDLRQHKRYGAWANSDLLLSLIARDMKRAGIPAGMLDLSDLPAGVSVDTAGFLAAVTIDLDRIGQQA
jgi:hypothetical protein